MKKKFTLFVFFITIITTFSCASVKSDPDRAKAIAEKSIEYMADKNYEDFVGLFYYEDKTTEAQTKQDFANAMAEKIEPEIVEKGGIKSYTITEATLNETGDRAAVTISITYGNGDVQSNINKLIKVDENWYMDFNK